MFQALSHPLRRRALRLFAERPRMYSELMEELGADSPTLAFHLKKLAGLVEKNERGFYELTELGKRALKVLQELEEAPQPGPAPEERDFVFHDRIILKIDNSLLELAKREGRKIRIYDVVIVEVDKDVDPKLLYEVVQEIRDVAVVKVPERLRAYVEPKTRDVAIVTSGGVLMSAIKLGIEALTYLAPLKAFRKLRGPLVEVYNGEFQHSGRLELEVSGGRVRLSKGANHVVAKCRDPDDFEISPGRISIEGCEVEITAEGLHTLVLDVAGGYIDVNGLALTALEADIAGGAVDAQLELSRGAVSIEAGGGVFAGRLSYKPFEGESQLRISTAGGVVSIDLQLPEEVGLAVSKSVVGGVARVPQSINRGRGVLSLTVDVAGGAAEVKVI
ncbi:winged helix-turn-helix domain-containing protein [Pyrobaculum aerophilum]|uniref:ArsR family transcriptional regulator n=1 Tax=Pyrobaculum aerophilum TaxID=13773 RepID=A0A371QXA4_9CREN|nr:transcriptional regulator [Pyrobaculum aerophilum]RFA93307.1 ArsR family transcriptional regulator [Pyrobaculum aerophilum]RFA95090.1 ArsR family transcriptional regulator [Pyrobaculum aerophilum]